MAVYIARSRRVLTHFLIREQPTDSTHVSDKELVSLINALTTAKSHKQIAAAIESSDLLIGDPEGAGKQPIRVMNPSELYEALQDEFEPTNAAGLSREMFLASPRKLRANSGRESPAAELDAYECNLTSKLAKMEGDCRILVEPVQDWMMFRNTIAIGASLLANIEAPREDERALEAAGFSRFAGEALGFPIFALPLKFSASTFALEFGRHPLRSGGLNPADVDYLYSRYYADEADITRKHGPIPTTTRPLGGDADVFLASTYIATRRGITALDIAKLLPVEKDTNVYLCVRALDGMGQIDLAKKVVRALWTKTQMLTDAGGSPLGMSPDPESLFDPLHKSEPYKCNSLVSSAWNALCFHSGRRLISCKYCGSGVLASAKGPAKEFCNDSCRTQYAERQND